MKKITLFLGLLLVATIAYAQGDKVYVINDFSKLLQSQVSPYLIPKNAAYEARNLRANDIVGSLSKRSKMLTYGTFGTTAVTSLHRYYKSDATQILLATGSTFIKSGSDTTGAFTTLRDELSDGLYWQWVTYKDTAIGCNGTNNCQKYDGHTQITANTDGSRTASILTTDLGAPYAELNTGANLDASAWYQYKVAYYNSSTGVYYYSNARSNPILTGAAVRDISLTDIPLGPTGTTNRYIYRTVGAASRAIVEADTTFYMVSNIADNTTSTLDDTVTDATADDDSAPTWTTASAGSEVTPPAAKIATLHKERLWLANSPSYNSYLYYSDPFNPDIFQIANYDYIRPDDGDAITFVKELLGILAIGKDNTISKYLTRNTDTTKWEIEGPFSFVGCPAPYSAASAPIGIIYLAWDGIYVFNGEHSELISDVVTKEIEDISTANFDESIGIYFQNEYHLAYTSEESGAADNDVVLVLDIVRDAYVLDDKSIASFAIFDSGTDYGTLYSGSSGTASKVLAHKPTLSNLIYRFKSDLEAGTRDSVVYSGTENEPEMSIGWGITIDSTTMTAVSYDSATYDSATINRSGLTGKWSSPVVEVTGNNYEKLYWHENLGANGNVIFEIRSASTAVGVTNDAGYGTDYSDPTGSDLSGETANTWAQLRASLSTTDITESPTIDSIDYYSIKLEYSKIGTAGETSVNTLWRSGYDDFGIPNERKRIWAIETYYTGTSGTIDVTLENSTGDTSKTFQIDLSVDPDDDDEDFYFGNGNYKIYKWYAPINEDTEPTPIGTDFQFTIEETGTTVWNIYQMLIRYEIEEYF